MTLNMISMQLIKDINKNFDYINFPYIYKCFLNENYNQVFNITHKFMLHGIQVI